MKIHSDSLTFNDINRATSAHGMRGVDADVNISGSRSRTHRFDVKLSGTSNRAQNAGTTRYANRGSDAERAATFDEWGMFIDFLFLCDEGAIIGQYKGYEHFKACTMGRYESLTQTYQHGNHKWSRSISSGVSECDCGASFDFNEYWRK